MSPLDVDETKFAKNTVHRDPFADVAMLFVVHGAVHTGATFVFASDGAKSALQGMRCSGVTTEGQVASAG